MSSVNYQPAKLFTVEEANRTLPLVRAITTDLCHLSRDVDERRQRLLHLTAGRGRDEKPSDPYSDELANIEAELEKDITKLEVYLDELKALGVEPKSAVEGLVDFPALIDDQLVFLCWKLGEPEILHWHGLEAGFAGRQPLTADSVADGGIESTSYEG